MTGKTVSEKQNSDLCEICPRRCHADRSKKAGFCRSGKLVSVAGAKLHMWEEPCISGKQGSGAVFFSGCSLGCVFCQNHEISSGSDRKINGEEISDKKLAEIFIKLQDMGAENINLVNPTHYTKNILNALDMSKHRLSIPVVWNTGGYEKPETVRLLKGYVDIFLPDFKYATPTLSEKYSGARDYPEYAMSAISEMFLIAGYPEFSESGMMQSGVLVRHLVLPSHVSESKLVIDRLVSVFDTERLWLSLMSQYFPAYRAKEYPEISRRLTTLEYQRITEYAAERGIIHGFCQERASATDKYVPLFSDKLEI